MIRRFLILVFYGTTIPLSLVFTIPFIQIGIWAFLLALFVSLSGSYFGIRIMWEQMLYLRGYLFIWRFKREWLPEMLKATGDGIF